MELLRSIAMAAPATPPTEQKLLLPPGWQWALY
jgi:hypothetical protein